MHTTLARGRPIYRDHVLKYVGVVVRLGSVSAYSSVQVSATFRKGH